MSDCYQPNASNPFMNYLHLGTNIDKLDACNVERRNIEKSFFENSILESNEKKTSELLMRHFYTQPETQVVNDSSFAKFLYPNTSSCRDSGYICKSNAEGLKNYDRIVLNGNSAMQYYKVNY
jgi:hypothetical protein